MIQQIWEYLGVKFWLCHCSSPSGNGGTPSPTKSIWRQRNGGSHLPVTTRLRLVAL